MNCYDTFRHAVQSFAGILYDKTLHVAASFGVIDDIIIIIIIIEHIDRYNDKK